MDVLGVTLMARLVEPHPAGWEWAMQRGGYPQAFIGNPELLPDNQVGFHGLYLPIVGAFPWGLNVEPD